MRILLDHRQSKSNEAHASPFSSNSLVIQSILPLKNALESKQAQLWVWGKPAAGDLKRPFKAAPGLFGMAGAQGPQTDKAAIKEAEKAGGAKKTE